MDDLSLNELNLSVRSYNALQKEGYKTVGEIIDLTEEELMNIRNLGRKSISEILAALKKYKIKRQNVKKSYFSDDIFFRWDDGYIYRDGLIKQGNFSAGIYAWLERQNVVLWSQLLRLDGKILEQLQDDDEKMYHDVEKIIETFEWHKLLEQELECEHYADGRDFCFEYINRIEKTLAVEASLIYEAIIPLLAKTNHDEAKSTDHYQIILGRRLRYSKENERILKSAILIWLKEIPFGQDIEGIYGYCQEFVVDITQMKQIVQEMVEEQSVVEIGDHYLLKGITLEEYLKSIKQKNKEDVMRNVLKGQTYNEIAMRNGTSRQRIQQVVSQLLAAAPILLEDRYHGLFERYSLTKEEFVEIFSETPETYFYLAKKYKKGKQAKADLLKDNSIPETYCDWKAKLKSMIENDTRRLMTRAELVTGLLKRAGSKRLSVEDIFLEIEKLKALVPENHLFFGAGIQLSYLYNLGLEHRILHSINGMRRYYEWDKYNFDYFFKCLDLAKYEDGEYSTLKFYSDNEELMQSYDIRDPYELHHLMRFLLEDESEFISFGRMPHLEIGMANRERQVREVLIDLSPATQDELAQAYFRKYGVLEKTFNANYLSCLEEFYKDGLYRLNQPQMAHEVVEAMKVLLSGDFYILDDVLDMARSKGLNVQQNLMSRANFKKIGFLMNNGYIVSDRFKSAREYFEYLLIENEVVDEWSIPTDVFKLGTFYACLAELKEQWRIFELESRTFISADKLNKMGISKEMLKDYIEKAESWMDEPFYTIFYLLKTGFCHELHRFYFDEWFYAALINHSPNICGHYKVANNSILYLDKKQTNFSDFVKYLIQKHSTFRLSLEELDRILEKEYGISYGATLKDKIGRSDVFYDSKEKMVYLDG